VPERFASGRHDLLRSTDRGKTWTAAHAGRARRLVDAKNGYFRPSGALWKTANAGRSGRACSASAPSAPDGVLVESRATWSSTFGSRQRPASCARPTAARRGTRSSSSTPILGRDRHHVERDRHLLGGRSSLLFTTTKAAANEHAERHDFTAQQGRRHAVTGSRRRQQPARDGQLPGPGLQPLAAPDARRRQRLVHELAREEGHEPVLAQAGDFCAKGDGSSVLTVKVGK
jgi:hypothetical protein